MRTRSALRNLALASVLAFLGSQEQRSGGVVAAQKNDAAEDIGSWSAGKLRSRSDEAMASGDYSRAVKYLTEASKQEPENSANHYKLYKVHHRKRKYVDALQEISKVVEMDKSDSLPSYRSQKAKLLVQLGQCDRAVAEFELIPSRTEKDEEGYETAVQCQETIEAADQAFFKENYQMASMLYQKAMGYVEVASDLMWSKAQSLFEIGDYYGVISDTGQLLKLHPQHLMAYELRGTAYQRLGEHEQAILHYREGIKLDPEHKGCKEGHKLVKKLEKSKKKGQDAFDKGDFESAVDNWTKAINVDPTHDAFNKPLELQIARALSKQGKHDTAIEMLEKIVAESETLEGLFALGEAQTEAEKLEEALQTYQRAFEEAPEGSEDERKAKQKVKEAQVALKQSKEKNYYKILGVARTATAKEIKSAYRKLALKWHPDKVSEEDKDKAETMFHDIGEAYEVLSSEELRGKYDRGEEVFEGQGGGQHHTNPFHFFNQQFHHQGRPGGGGQRVHFRFN